jgi:hypothetical protein
MILKPAAGVFPSRHPRQTSLDAVMICYLAAHLAGLNRLNVAECIY